MLPMSGSQLCRNMNTLNPLNPKTLNKLASKAMGPANRGVRSSVSHSLFRVQVLGYHGSPSGFGGVTVWSAEGASWARMFQHVKFSLNFSRITR